MENLEKQGSSLFDLSIDPSCQQSLEQTSKWARFLAIVFTCGAVLGTIGFALAGNAIYSLLASNDLFAAFSSFVFVFVIIVLAIVVIFILLLFRFANCVINGIRENNQQELEKGIAALKNYLIFSGVLGGISLIFSLIGFFN
jgi:membrane protein YdbS with pleckstrin-like domain